MRTAEETRKVAIKSCEEKHDELMKRIKAQVDSAAEKGDMYTWCDFFVTDRAEKELQDLGYELKSRNFVSGTCRISWESPCAELPLNT